MTELDGARVLVTGAASGIGRLMAVQAARRGASIVAWDIDRHGLDDLSATLAGAVPLAQVVDVADRDAVHRAAAEVEQTIGGVDVLVLNAGVTDARRLLDLPDEVVERVLAVNVLGLFWCTKAFLPGMVQRGYGHVVTIASSAATSPCPGMATYVASKHAAQGFAETLRHELRADAPGVRTTLVLPHFIDTGMFAGAGAISFFRNQQGEDVARSVLDAVEADHERLVLPRIVLVAFPLRMLPPRAYDWLADRLGLTTSMATFAGRAVQAWPAPGSVRQTG
jgi:all-trans-retinol dehydrogenase (NAD+)